MTVLYLVRPQIVAPEYGKIVAGMPRDARHIRGVADTCIRGEAMETVPPPTEKACDRCATVKVIDSYSPSKRYRDGFLRTCKACISVANRAYYLKRNGGQPRPRKVIERGPIDEKRCSSCHEVKPSTSFYSDRRTATGLVSACRQCHSQSRKDQYRANPEYFASRVRLRRAQNIEAERQRDRERYAANLEMKRAAGRAAYAANAEERKQRVMAYRRANPLKVALIEQKRRAQRAGNPGGIRDTDWIALCHSYGNQCLACRRVDVPLTMDHVVPLSIGGAHHIDNVQPLCKRCNSSKGTKTIDYRTA